MINYHKKDKNIFKTISKKVDPISYNNNKKSAKLCFYEIDDNKIQKYFINKEMFDWDVTVYLYLVDKKLVPLANAEKQKIMYHINDKTPLYNILKNDSKNAKNILNSLFSFINKFKKIYFVHGNLHLYNIFVCKENLFTIIDFSYSTFKEKCTNLFNNKFKNFKGDIYTIDIYLIYIELKDFYKNDYKMSLYLENLLKEYINYTHHNYNL